MIFGFRSVILPNKTRSQEGWLLLAIDVEAPSYSLQHDSACITIPHSLQGRRHARQAYPGHQLTVLRPRDNRWPGPDSFLRSLGCDLTRARLATNYGAKGDDLSRMARGVFRRMEDQAEGVRRQLLAADFPG
jgi:hypothetical protein